MQKIFIDCGFFKGLGTSLFEKSEYYDESFLIHAFDPQLNMRRVQKRHPQVIFHKEATWTYDGEIDFYTSKRRGGAANSIFPNARAKEENIKKTPCIDFSKWILDNFQKNDHIILKMDIEGAEYEVLDKMIKDGSMEYINLAFIEFHTQRHGMDFDIKERQTRIKKSIQKIEDLDIKGGIEWALEFK